MFEVESPELVSIFLASRIDNLISNYWSVYDKLFPL